MEVEVKIEVEMEIQVEWKWKWDRKWSGSRSGVKVEWQWEWKSNWKRGRSGEEQKRICLQQLPKVLQPLRWGGRCRQHLSQPPPCILPLPPALPYFPSASPPAHPAPPPAAGGCGARRGASPCPSRGGCGVGRLLAGAILGPDRWQAAAPAQEGAGTEHSWAAGPGHPGEKPHRVPGAKARRSQPVPHALCKQGMGKKSAWDFFGRFPHPFLTPLPAPPTGEAPA